ncbi:MAG TPA: hypothetical protein ENN63_04320 [Bacteroidetes bacterium]|nr:hypothetical protein [Bacteroidota bacterium]
MHASSPGLRFSRAEAVCSGNVVRNT